MKGPSNRAAIGDLHQPPDTQMTNSTAVCCRSCVAYPKPVNQPPTSALRSSSFSAPHSFIRGLENEIVALLREVTA